MCLVSIAVDQSIHTVSPVFDAVETSPFYICSVRVVPVAWSRKAEVYFNLGGGSTSDLKALLGRLNALPAVLSTTHTAPPV
jgi:hypothetical protein